MVRPNLGGKMKEFGCFGFFIILCFFPLFIFLPLGGIVYILQSFNVPKFMYYIIGGLIGLWLARKI